MSKASGLTTRSKPSTYRPPSHHLVLFLCKSFCQHSESSRASSLEEAKHRDEESDRASLSPYPHKHHHDDENNDPKQPKDPDEEYQRAQQAILNAVTTVENHAQRLIAAEVDTFFHGLDPKEKKKVAKKAKRAVAEGSRKVKETVSSDSKKESYVFPFENHPYPYYHHPPINNKKDDASKKPQHKDHRILKAIEAAEHAVLHAIEAEVDTLFHNDEAADQHHEHEQQHKATVQSGLKKASEQVQDQNKDRRDWLAKFAEKEIEAYTQQTMFGLQ